MTGSPIFPPTSGAPKVYVAGGAPRSVWRCVSDERSTVHEMALSVPSSLREWERA